MNSTFSIVSDGSCDLPEQMIKDNDIGIVHFLVSFDGHTYKKEGVEINLDDLYQQMTDDPNTYPKSAAPSPEDFYQVFKEKAKTHQDILCICISTKLSSSVQSAEIAKQMLEDDDPDIRVVVVDSLCATLMQGAYVLEACRMRDLGFSLDETLATMERLRSTGRILFTVGDLSYLEHGGRIGRVTSLAGNLLNIKPLITLQDGEIHSSGIKRGRKKSLAGVLDLLTAYLEEYHCQPDDCIILLGYSHDYEEGRMLQDMTNQRLQERYGTGYEVPLYRIGATIGVHAGPTSIGYGVIMKNKDCRSH